MFLSLLMSTDGGFVSGKPAIAEFAVVTLVRGPKVRHGDVRYLSLSLSLAVTTL